MDAQQMVPPTQNSTTAMQHHPRPEDGKRGHTRSFVWRCKQMDNFCYKPDATKNQAGPYTHFFLDGGVASLNDKDQLGIREAMVQDIKNKTMPPITENRPMWFAYFVDLDLLIKSELSKEAVIELRKS